MENNILLSILIPSYNTEKHVKKCLESILEQNLKNCEILIFDDESTDKTVDVIEEIIKENKKDNKKNINIKLAKINHCGLSSVRNKLIKEAKGKYLLFVDSDDYAEKDLIDTLKDTIEKDDYDLIRFKAKVHNDTSYKSKERFNSKVFGILSMKDAIINWSNKDEEWAVTWLYCHKKDVIIKNNIIFDEGKIHEDFGTVPKIILNAKKIYSVDYVGYNYVKRNNSIIENHEEEYEWKKSIDYLYQYDSIIEYLKEIKIDKSDKELYDLFVSDLKKRMPEKLRFLNTEKYKNMYIKELEKREIEIKGSYSFS